MMSTTYVIPCDSDQPDFGFDCELDGVTYNFAFDWNERESAWFMSLADADGNPLVSGQRVVVGWQLASRCVGAQFPPGQLVCIDTTDQALDPAFDDLGRRVQILYISVT